MRKQNTSSEDKLKRIQELAGIKPLNEDSNKGNLNTVTYSEKIKDTTFGIIKENGFYYIKTSTADVIKESTDFNYIGGLANKGENKFKSYADALKNLNMIKITINESIDKKDCECDDNEVIEERLQQDINSEQPPLAPGESPLPPAPAPQQQAPAPSPEPMPSELPPPAPEAAPSPEGMPPAPEGEAPVDDDSDLNDNSEGSDVDHYLGKLTYAISQTPEEELSEDKIKAIMNSVISALPLDRISPEERLVLAKRVKRGGKKEGEQNDAPAPSPEEQPQGEAPAPSPEPAPEEEPVQEGKYPWKKCEADQEKEYGSKKTADKVCGAIKAHEIDEEKIPVCNPADEKKMNEFYSKLDRSQLIYENSSLKYKNALIESDSKNTLSLSNGTQKFTFNVSTETVKKYDSLINETKVLSEQNIKLNKVIK